MDFYQKANNAEFWFVQSHQMFEASKVLFQSMISADSSDTRVVGSHKGSMFFLGIALENAIKGLLAYKGLLIFEKEKLSTHKSFPKCKPHDLGPLINLLEVEVDISEQSLLERLSIYTIWAGKYGTPIAEDDFINSNHKLFQKENDFTIASSLISRLQLLSGFTIESGWPIIKK